MLHNRGRVVMGLFNIPCIPGASTGSAKTQPRCRTVSMPGADLACTWARTTPELWRLKDIRARDPRVSTCRHGKSAVKLQLTIAGSTVS